MVLDSSHLELLAALARSGSLGAASTQINLSPSAASRRLKDAERLLGVPLTAKTGRTRRLTAAGRVLADAAISSSAQLSEAELAARWLGSAENQPVRIGIGFHDAISWLLPRFDQHPYEVRRRRPDARFTAANRSEALDLTVDVTGPVPVGAVSLQTDELRLVVPPDHELADGRRITVADLAPHPYLVGESEPIPGFEFERYFLPSGATPNRIVPIESFSLLIDLVAAGHGVSIQPTAAVVALGRVDVVVVALDRTIPVNWVAESNGRLSDRTAQFINLMNGQPGGQVPRPGIGSD